MVIQQRGFFIVTHLPWHGTFIYIVISEDLWHSHVLLSVSSRAVATCFNDLGLLRLGFEHTKRGLRSTLTDCTTAAIRQILCAQQKANLITYMVTSHHKNFCSKGHKIYKYLRKICIKLACLWSVQRCPEWLLLCRTGFKIYFILYFEMHNSVITHH